MIETHAMGNARAAVVADQEEPVMAELFHHFDHVFGHHAMAVIDEPRAGIGKRGIAVAAQIRTHNVVALRQFCSDRMPKHMIVGIAMKQEQRRPRTSMTHANDGALRPHIEMLEAGKQRYHVVCPDLRGYGHTTW